MVYKNKEIERIFKEKYADDEKWQQLVAKLTLGHNLLLIKKIKDKNIRKIYAENTIKNGWSRNVLSVQIETEFHKRIGNSNNNFNLSLPPKDILDKLPTEDEINLYLDIEGDENDE